MGEEDLDRAVAWAAEMRRVHARLRDAVTVVRDSLADGRDPAAAGDLLLYCWGFCTALTGHHAGEDRVLFPALQDERPDLTEVLDRLRQDHRMIDHLLRGLVAAAGTAHGPEELTRHLDGVEAVMESHFGYEERQLLPALADLGLAAEVDAVFGPLAGPARPDVTPGAS